jgi:hypothetical protein
MVGEWMLGRKVFWRGWALLISILLLGGCETQRDGLDYSAMARKVGPPKAGHARIVVLREKALAALAMGPGTFSSMERR